MKDPRIKVLRLNVFHGHAVVFKHSLICIKTSPIRSRDKNVLRNEIYELLKLPLVLSDPLFGPPALDELSDLASDVGHPLKHVVVRFSNVASKELLRTERLSTEKDGETEPAVQVSLCGERNAQEIAIL